MMMMMLIMCDDVRDTLEKDKLGFMIEIENRNSGEYRIYLPIYQKK